MMLKSYWDYSQPDFYRFNEDSIWLAKAASDICKYQKIDNLLDLFAGSGVIGLEILTHEVINPHTLVFIEKQQGFEPHLNKNIDHFAKKFPSTIVEMYITDFRKYDYKERQFNLIVANPPYFLQDQSRLSPSQNKALCRTLMGFNFEDIFAFVDNGLAPMGSFLFTCRFSKQELEKKITGSRKLELLEEKKGTRLFLYR